MEKFGFRLAMAAIVVASVGESVFASKVHCNANLISSNAIAANPRRAELHEILNTPYPRRPGPPPFPGATDSVAVDTQQPFLESLRQRILRAGFEQVRHDAEACSSERDCAMTAVSEVEGRTFDLRAFLRNPNYLEQHYLLVAAPNAGDLVVYQMSSEPFALGYHFAVVRGVSPSGQVLVESKFGRIPGTYLHGVEEVPFSYGTHYYFLRYRGADVAQPRPTQPPPFPGRRG